MPSKKKLIWFARWPLIASPVLWERGSQFSDARREFRKVEVIPAVEWQLHNFAWTDHLTDVGVPLLKHGRGCLYLYVVAEVPSDS